MSKFKNRSYRLTVEHPPISFILQTKPRKRNPLLHFDEKSGTNRSLRYAINQKSPFLDEQDGNAILEPVVFENGMLNVSADNQVLQQFLDLHPLNGKAFIELDPTRDAEEEVERMDIEADALIEVKKLSLEEYIRVARGVLNRNTSNMSSAEVKRDVMVFARKNPKEFLNALKDPSLSMNDFVGQLSEFKMISFRNKGRDIYFNLPQNKSKILTVPFGENKLQTLSKYLQSDEGLTTLKLLKDAMDQIG